MSADAMHGAMLLIATLEVAPEKRRAALDAMYGAAEVAAAAQLIDWARAWVENETCIEQVPRDRLDQPERDGLAFLAAARAWGLL